MGSIPVRSTKKHRMQFCIRCFLVFFLVNRPRFVNMACHILAEGLPLAGNGKFPSKKRLVVIISRYCSTRKLPFLAFCGYEYKRRKTAELSFRYDVIVTLPQSLPNGVSITVDGIGGTVASDGKTVTFTNYGGLSVFRNFHHK